MSLLLNPRVWIAVAIIGVIVVLQLRIGALKVQLASEKSKSTILSAEVEKWKLSSDTQRAALSDCSKNLTDIKASNEEMQTIAAKTNVLVKRLKKADTVIAAPGTCNCPVIKIGGEYAQVISLANDGFNSRVRGKVGTHKLPDSGKAAPEVLPKADPAAAGK